VAPAFPAADGLYEDNLRLSRLEYDAQHLYLQSRPRCLGLVLGNACNIDCPHCYQTKNGDNLLKPPSIGRELRREFMAFYPFLASLRVQGGEAFAYSGFRDLLDDLAATVSRPILSVSTNGTLIDEEWAERIVRLPFLTLTVSLDGATPATYARLRRGADLDRVLENTGRVRRWKEKLGSALPHLDSFFVVMRSNFREIPQYLELARTHGFLEVSLQTAEINANNLERDPSIDARETIVDRAEVEDLHSLLREALPDARRHLRAVRTSGLTSLFEAHGLDTSFLREQSDGLYPNGGDLVAKPAATIPLCPNPWTTLFVVENGDVHLCFLATPVGNLYETSLAAIWNSPAALAKRSDMIAGRYLQSGCSERWCSWREGKPAAAPEPTLAALRDEMGRLASRAAAAQPLVQIGEQPAEIVAVRRMLADRDRRVHELEVMFARLCETNAEAHAVGQQQIDSVAAELAAARACGQAASADRDRLAAILRTLPGRLASRIASLRAAPAPRPKSR
jgi:MoaA/NifB/PqqE/SkfB family radical SAM enzyme